MHRQILSGFIIACCFLQLHGGENKSNASTRLKKRREQYQTLPQGFVAQSPDQPVVENQQKLKKPIIIRARTTRSDILEIALKKLNDELNTYNERDCRLAKEIHEERKQLRKKRAAQRRLCVEGAAATGFTSALGLLGGFLVGSSEVDSTQRSRSGIAMGLTLGGSLLMIKSYVDHRALAQDIKEYRARVVRSKLRDDLGGIVNLYGRQQWLLKEQWKERYHLAMMGLLASDDEDELSAAEKIDALSRWHSEQSMFIDQRIKNMAPATA